MNTLNGCIAASASPGGLDFSALYNRVEGLGIPELDADTLTAYLTYYLMRNFKIMAEFTATLRARARRILKNSISEWSVLAY